MVKIDILGLLTVFSDLWSDTKRYPSVKALDTNMTTKWNNNFDPGFIQSADFGSWNVFKYAHISWDNGSFAYLNMLFQRTCNTKNNCLIVSN